MDSNMPTFEDMMLPVLIIIKGGREYKYSEVEKALVGEMGIGGEERTATTANGQRILYHRLTWAKYHLKNHKLIEARTTKFKITDIGKKLLDNPPKKLELKFLKKYPKIIKDDEPEFPKSKQTPAELIRQKIDQLHKILVNDLREKMTNKSITSTNFETIVGDVFKKLGYGDVTRVGRSNDGGVDIEIKRDKLGLDATYCQVKQFSKGKIGPEQVRSFAGALSGKKASRGVFVTLSDFTAEARNAAKDSEKRIELINGNELIDLMIEHDVGVSEEETYKRKRVNNDYFERLSSR